MAQHAELPDEQRNPGSDQAEDPPLPFWRNPALVALFVLCLLPELVLSGADWGLWGSAHWRLRVIQYAGFWAGLLDNWRPNYALQPWAMFLTYGFLHAGFMHFAVNMMTLFSLAPPLADRFGNRGFLLLYAASIIGGALGFALLSGQVLPMVGASGALFGLAGAHIALHYRARRASHDPLTPVLRAMAGLVALNLILWWAMSGQLAWETHLGGFVTGWIVALLLDRRLD
jgi:rhomboid protease GluP